MLDGTPVRWDEFPMPTAETFGLTGEDAIIYNAIAQVYNPKVYADTFSQSPEDVTDLSLTAFEIYEKSKSENGNTIYYGVFYECDYYNPVSYTHLGGAFCAAPCWASKGGRDPL